MRVHRGGSSYHITILGDGLRVGQWVVAELGLCNMSAGDLLLYG